jgi:hypothetical protein
VRQHDPNELPTPVVIRVMYMIGALTHSVVDLTPYLRSRNGREPLLVVRMISVLNHSCLIVIQNRMRIAQRPVLRGRKKERLKGMIRHQFIVKTQRLQFWWHQAKAVMGNEPQPWTGTTP